MLPHDRLAGRGPFCPTCWGLAILASGVLGFVLALFHFVAEGYLKPAAESLSEASDEEEMARALRFLQVVPRAGMLVILLAFIIMMVAARGWSSDRSGAANPPTEISVARLNPRFGTSLSGGRGRERLDFVELVEPETKAGAADGFEILGDWGSSSMALRSQLTWTSTVRVSPA